VAELKEDRAVVEVELTAGGKLCATGRGLFVAVKPGHPGLSPLVKQIKTFS
jgi:acyl-CoA thioesterase FadM